MNEKKRIEWIDLAKGICILMVVFGHTEVAMKAFGVNAINTVMSAFRMPLFFLLSGLFFKNNRNFYIFLKKKINHLAIPYIVFTAIGLAAPLFIAGPVWFLYSLFMINMIGYAFLALSKDKPITLLVISLILSVIGYNLHFDQLINHWLISVNVGYTEAALVGLPFFIIGYLIRNHTHFMSEETNIKRDIPLAALLLSLAIVVDYIYDWADTYYSENRYGLPFFWTLILGISGSATILLIARWLKKVPLVSFLGRYSIIVLITHATILSLLYQVAELFLPGEDDWYIHLGVFITTVLLEIPTIFFCRKYLPYLFAQKELLKV